MRSRRAERDASRRRRRIGSEGRGYTVISEGFAARCRRLAVHVALTFVIATPIGVLAAEDTGIGVVAAYGPPSSRFTFARPPHDDAVPVRIGTVVMAGDRITLP